MTSTTKKKEANEIKRQMIRRSHCQTKHVYHAYEIV